MIESFIKTVLDEAGQADLRRIAGDHPAAVLALADMLKSRNRPSEALALCDALLEEDPTQEAAALFAVRLLAGLRRDGAGAAPLARYAGSRP